MFEEMRKYLVTYKEAVSHIRLCNRSLRDFLTYEEILFSFLSVYRGKTRLSNLCAESKSKTPSACLGTFHWMHPPASGSRDSPPQPSAGRSAQTCRVRCERRWGLAPPPPAPLPAPSASSWGGQGGSGLKGIVPRDVSESFMFSYADLQILWRIVVLNINIFIVGCALLLWRQ